MMTYKRATVSLLGAAGLIATCVAALAATSTSAEAHGRPTVLPTAVVSLGDSYISGEAGRWLANTAATSPGRLGTDRAWRADAANPAGVVDRSLVYGTTVVNACHRSDVAEVKNARLPVQKVINLACSGAKTINVLRASAGGVALRGEAPQNDQLAGVARANKVKVIVLSIGGNDLGFGSIVNACVVSYLTSSAPCNSTQQAAFDSALPKMATAVGATLDDIRATMARTGYHRNDYRIVLQSYPAPLPAAGKNRYTGTAADARGSVGGCPFLDGDSAWAHSTLIRAITTALSGQARSRGVQFLDLSDAFHGHELCASAAQQSTGTPSSGTSEWVRFIDLAGQGDVVESLHPNAFGQKALGRCLRLAFATSRNVACHAVAKRSTQAIYLTKVR